MDFENILYQTVKTGDIDKITKLITSNAGKLFDTPKLKKHYELLVGIDLIDSTATLLVAWLALLSGDNISVYKLVQRIDVNLLSIKDMALFWDLKALSSAFGGAEARLENSQRALDIMDENDKTFYMANAKLTHGQVLAGHERFREAAEFFLEAYELFLGNELLFPAATSLTNALLNWTRMAEFDKALEKAKSTLLMASSYKSDKYSYWDMLYIPLGMIYLEQNKTELGLEYLKKAQKIIDDMELIHMHGYVEMYLIKAYSILGQLDEIQILLEKLRGIFKNMHYPMMRYIMAYANIHLGNKFLKPDIELMEADYDNVRYGQPILIEMLAYLYNKGQSDLLSVEDMCKIIYKYRFTGDLVSLQMLLLLLAERYYLNKDIKSAVYILEDAIELYTQKGLKAPFHLYSYECWPLIRKLSPKIKKTDESNRYFTDKEIDVLKLIVQGKSNKEIGEVLFIGIGTVKWHINNILSKMEVKNRTQAAKKAREQNLV